MRVRQSLANGLAAAFILTIAIVTVGLTAATDSPFSIAVKPVLVRLGVDLDIKVGSMHLHASWSALSSTKAVSDGF